MVKLLLPPVPRGPMFTADIMTVEWQDFFRSLYERVGGYDGYSVEELAIAVVAGLFNTPTNFGARIDELERRLDSLPSPKSYDREIAETLRRLCSGPSPKPYDRIIEEVARSFYTRPDMPLVHPTSQAYSWLPASATRAAGAKPATIGLNGNGFVVASFADGQEEIIQFNLKIPDGIDRSRESQICIGWSSPTISQDCDWELTYLVTAVGDSTEQAGTQMQDYISSSSVADGLVVSPFEIAGGVLGLNDVCIHCYIMRDGNDGDDDLGDVAEVHGVAFAYTKNKFQG